VDWNKRKRYIGRKGKRKYREKIINIFLTRQEVHIKTINMINAIREIKKKIKISIKSIPFLGEFGYRRY